MSPKLDKLRSHIMKELSLTYKEFYKYFPKFLEFERKEELREMVKRARLVRSQILKGQP